MAHKPIFDYSSKIYFPKDKSYKATNEAFLTVSTPEIFVSPFKAA